MDKVNSGMLIGQATAGSGQKISKTEMASTHGEMEVLTMGGSKITCIMVKEPLFGKVKDRNIKVCGTKESSMAEELFPTRTAASIKEIGRTTSAMVMAK